MTFDMLVFYNNDAIFYFVTSNPFKNNFEWNSDIDKDKAKKHTNYY
ncbi:hypothetical protein TKO01_23200 [Tetragenococcus koreensis]|nr:hypothetical protein TKO01_23200 [Tetragenococcus koreensis]